MHPASQQGRYIGLLQSEQIGRFRLRELAALENVPDFPDKLRFQQLFLGPLRAEVSEDVAAAAFYGHWGFHRMLL
jgi:hypothetical protein